MITDSAIRRMAGALHSLAFQVCVAEFVIEVRVMRQRCDLREW